MGSCNRNTNEGGCLHCEPKVNLWPAEKLPTGAFTTGVSLICTVLVHSFLFF